MDGEGVARTPAELHEVVGAASISTGPLDVFGGGTVYPLLRCLAGFTLGLVTFRLAKCRRVMRLANLPLLGTIAAVAVCGLLATPNSDVVVVIFSVPLILTQAAEQSFVARALRHGTVYWLGLVSYSIYLVHDLVAENLRQPIIAVLGLIRLPHIYSVAGPITVAVTFLLASAAYYGLEKPAQDWARALRSRRALSHGPG